MSRRESEDSSAPKSAGETQPRREPEDEVDHARLAQLVAANYAPPPAPFLSRTLLDAPPAAVSASQDDAPPLMLHAPRSAVVPRPSILAAQAQSMPQTAAAPRAAAPKRISLFLAGAALVLLALVSCALFGWMAMLKPTSGPPKVGVGDPPRNVVAPHDGPDASVTQMFVPGGTFRMGRDDAPKTLINEYPAHAVAVQHFLMDRTEVTNAEYAKFVRETGHRAPSNEAPREGEESRWEPWADGKPPAGQEQWPVRNVSLAEAVAFAAWRSKRDGVLYRLPTEEEWEYAARSGGTFRLYPWGDEFFDDRAGVDAAFPRPVGSYPQGASREGVLDLIGNVWEWTASDATAYPGNRDPEAAGKGMKVARGGSYQSSARGSAAVTATSRTYIPPETKHPTLGFRLVRDGP
ncbi:MAG TPA: SUMF1/EgtB/PvdO family nonheme iron enzyme [Pyrinomonadaceae bacterium]